MKQKLVVLTGAGISAESGLKTFRDADGLWEGHRIEDVATPEAWQRNKKLVLDFYNERRRQLLLAKPNPAHFALVDFEKDFHVNIITQNVDDLHERAGSSNILHLHGQLRKARSTRNYNYIIDFDGDMSESDRDDQNNPLRPHIVWFGEAVPELPNAANIISEADLVFIVGTSMQVYPAASLIDYAPPQAQVHYIDLNPADVSHIRRKINIHSGKAAEILPALFRKITS